MRFAWRNDVFEFDLLHRLGRLHAEKLDYRNALLTLRQAATYYSNIKGAEALTGEMSELFKRVYNSGQAEKSAPIVLKICITRCEKPHIAAFCSPLA